MLGFPTARSASQRAGREETGELFSLENFGPAHSPRRSIAYLLYPDLRSRPRRVTVSAHRPGPIIAHHRVTLWSATAQARDGSGRDRMLCAPDLSSEGTFYDQSPGNPEGLRAPVRGYDPYRPAQIRPAPHMYCRAGLIACGVSRAGRRNHISSHFYLLNCQSSSIRSKLPSAQDRVKLD